MASGKKKHWVGWAIGIAGLLIAICVVNQPKPVSPYIVYTEHRMNLLDLLFDVYGLPKGAEGDICILDITSHRTFNLTANGENKRPTVSPEGKIYYASGKESSEKIWVINLKKKTNQPLFEADYYCTNPVCSHSGRNLLFEGRPNEARDILRCNSEGTEIKTLTRGVALCGSPDWSPDDRKIVYDCRANGDFFSLWVMDSSGGNALPVLADYKVNYQRPAWQPNGRWIAFQSDKASNKYNDCGIFAVKIDGSGKTEKMVNVAVDGHNNRNPRWSADGRFIVYQSYRTDQTSTGSVASDFDLYAVEFDENMTHEPACLTATTTNEVDPCWLPVFKEDYLKKDLARYLSDGIKTIDSVFMKQNGI